MANRTRFTRADERLPARPVAHPSASSTSSVMYAGAVAVPLIVGAASEPAERPDRVPDQRRSVLLRHSHP